MAHRFQQGDRASRMLHPAKGHAADDERLRGAEHRSPSELTGSPAKIVILRPRAGRDRAGMRPDASSTDEDFS